MLKIRSIKITQNDEENIKELETIKKKLDMAT
jgi:hypothetical protein